MNYVRFSSACILYFCRRKGENGNCSVITMHQRAREKLSGFPAFRLHFISLLRPRTRPTWGLFFNDCEMWGKMAEQTKIPRKLLPHYEILLRRRFFCHFSSVIYSCSFLRWHKNRLQFSSRGSLFVLVIKLVAAAAAATVVVAAAAGAAAASVGAAAASLRWRHRGP